MRNSDYNRRRAAACSCRALLFVGGTGELPLETRGVPVQLPGQARTAFEISPVLKLLFNAEAIQAPIRTYRGMADGETGLRIFSQVAWTAFQGRDRCEAATVPRSGHMRRVARRTSAGPVLHVKVGALHTDRFSAEWAEFAGHS